MKQDRLKAVFETIKQDAPSMSFENNLMQRIRAEQIRKVRWSNRIAVFSIFGGVAFMLLVPVIVLWILEIPISSFFASPSFNLVNIFRSIEIDPMTVSISLVCFFLLLIDSLIRRRLDEKHRKE